MATELIPDTTNKTHSRRALSVWRNRHVWYIAFLILATSILTFNDFILGLIGLPYTEWGAIDTVHSLHWLLHLLPVLYAAYVFRVRGTVIVTLIVMLLCIPAGLFPSPDPAHLVTSMSFIALAGAVGVLIAISRNQREQVRKAYLAAVESEENLRTYLENAPDGVYLNDLKGTFLNGNKKAEEITGYKKEEVIFLPLWLPSLD